MFCWDERVEVEDEARVVSEDDEGDSRALRVDVETVDQFHDKRDDAVIVVARHKLKIINKMKSILDFF